MRSCWAKQPSPGCGIILFYITLHVPKAFTYPQYCWAIPCPGTQRQIIPSIYNSKLITKIFPHNVVTVKGREIMTTHVLFPMTLLMFIWTVSCFKLMANTTSVSHGAPCGPAVLLFLLKEGVEVFVTESRREWTKIRREEIWCVIHLVANKWVNKT